MSTERTGRGRVVVTGGRDYSDREKVRQVLVELPKDTLIVHGGGLGADILVHKVAKELGLAVQVHAPDWHRYGKAAGPLRNREMLAPGADALIAFPGGGRGTRDAIRAAEELGIPVIEIEEEPSTAIEGDGIDSKGDR